MVLSPVSVLSNRERNQSVWNILLLGSVQITSHIQQFKRGNDLFSEGLVQFNSESHWVWMKHKSRIVVRIEPKSWLTWPVYSFKQIKWSSHLCRTSPFKFCQHSPFKIEGCAIAHWMSALKVVCMVPYTLRLLKHTRDNSRSVVCSLCPKGYFK